IKGKVTDSMDALVPGAPIVFSNDVRSYKVNAKGIDDDDAGMYQIALEPGKYKVSVGGSLGFDITYRSEILVDPDSRRTLNLRVYVKEAVVSSPLWQGKDDVSYHPAIDSYG